MAAIHDRSFDDLLREAVAFHGHLCPAIQALTGVSLGKRTLKHVDHGKTAATFVDTVTGAAVRVAAREEARGLARLAVPREPDPRRAQAVAYRALPEADLLKLDRVAVDAAWLARQRVRVRCEACGEGVNYQREVRIGERTLCRACAGDRYDTVLDGPGASI